MKVLFFDTTQAYLTPGGKQVHTHNLFHALKEIGVEVEYSRWWDPDQNFDIIHFFGYNAPYLLEHVKNRSKKAVLTQIMDVHTSLSPQLQYVYGAGIKLLKFLPEKINKRYSAVSLDRFDAVVYINHYDKQSAKRIFGINEKKSFVIPHAFDAKFQEIDNSGIFGLPQKYLVSVGSIIPRKRSILLAELAKASKTPIVFIGRCNDNEYGEKFRSMVDNEYVYYLGFANQKIKAGAMANASGFVLLSEAESGCIAVHEAAAIGLPILLPEAKWAKAYHNPKEVYFCNIKSNASAVADITQFFEKSERKPYHSFKLYSWNDIARMYEKVYRSVLHKKAKTTTDVKEVRSLAS
jgi:glycosyltransferase involved in cell wall biosynthesis